MDSDKIDNSETTENSEAGQSAPLAENLPAGLYHPGAIHIQPTGETMFQGGFVGGLHIGPGGDRLPGSDPLHEALLERKYQKIEGGEPLG